MPTAASKEQSQRVAAEMSHWLDLFDQELALGEVELPKRPMRALIMLFEHKAIVLNAENDFIEAIDISSHAETVWFRVLYAAVEYWYVKRFGAPAVKGRGNAPLEGVLLVRNVPYLLRLPANRRKVEIEGEQVWMYFEEDLGGEEVAHEWIVDGPDLGKLDPEESTLIETQARTVASTLRYIEFRRVTARADGNEASRQLVVNTLISLQHAARRIAGGRPEDRGPAWFDLQMANESALKAVIRLHSDTHPRIHDLKRLLVRACSHGVTFDAARLDDFPAFDDIGEWRYGQGHPWRLEWQYSAYLLTIDLVRACMASVPAGMISGFGLLLRYPPWLSDTGCAERED